MSQCPSLSFRFEHHHGVPISAIIFGGRRAHLAPPVYEAFNWAHGVYVGAIMASERAAAQYVKQGEVRRDPMAMPPFCGYNMADYFDHWLRMGVRMHKPPHVFHVNWFPQDEHGKYLRPGYGENLRVLGWILAWCNNKVEAQKTAIGWLPKPKDLPLEGLDLPHTGRFSPLSISMRTGGREEISQRMKYQSLPKTNFYHTIRKDFSLQSRDQKRDHDLTGYSDRCIFSF